MKQIANNPFTDILISSHLPCNNFERRTNSRISASAFRVSNGYTATHLPKLCVFKTFKLQRIILLPMNLFIFLCLFRKRQFWFDGFPKFWYFSNSCRNFFRFVFWLPKKFQFWTERYCFMIWGVIEKFYIRASLLLHIRSGCAAASAATVILRLIPLHHGFIGFIGTGWGLWVQL